METQKLTVTDARESSTKAIKELSDALAAGKSDKLVEYLDFMAKFHSYSFRNQWLIAMQRPDARHVAGFNRWLKLGRAVRKGEKGIMILAPCVFSKEADSGDPETVRFFKATYVFDVSQTDGTDIPEYECKPSGDPAEYTEKLKSYIADNGITLTYKAISNGADGYATTGNITVDTSLSPAAEFSVLVHELTHTLLHLTPDAKAEKLSKTVKETEAEAVAYVVGTAIGLDGLSASSDYIHLYQGKPEHLSASLNRIQKTADTIISAIL